MKSQMASLIRRILRAQFSEDFLGDFVFKKNKATMNIDVNQREIINFTSFQKLRTNRN